MKDGYCENCLNPAECYLSGRCWPVVDYVPDAGKLCAEMDDTAATPMNNSRMNAPAMASADTQTPKDNGTH